MLPPAAFRALFNSLLHLGVFDFQLLTQRRFKQDLSINCARKGCLPILRRGLIGSIPKLEQPATSFT